MHGPDQHRATPGLAEVDDERLAALIRAGDPAAFEALHRRHHPPLLAFCRRMLCNREDAEDALQHTFLRAYRALSDGPPPRTLRPWLYAIARNRCLTQLADRAAPAAPLPALERATNRLADDVERRARLGELVADLLRLPPDQRGALVLSELGDLDHAEIGAVLRCPAAKVRALIFQARATLIADRDARDTPCAEVRRQLATARGGALRCGPLRRHLRQCEPCRRFVPVAAGKRHR